MKIIEKEFNVQTGKETITERDETVAEKNAREKRVADLLTVQAEIEAKEAARQAILDRLGLSVDDVKLLLG